jgi:putative MATE family efflux protein
VLLVAVALVLTVVASALLDPLLRASGASEAVLPYARDFLRIIMLGSVFQMVGFGLNAVIRGEGNPRIAMLTMLIGVLLNVVLAPIFIFVFRWGMKGAAAATVIAQAVSALWVLAYFLRGRSLLKLRLRNLALSGPLCRTILAMGSPHFAIQIAASVLNSILNNQLRTHGGDLAVSVMGILYPMFMLIAMPIFGINQGAQPIIGYNYGARRFDRVKKTLQTAILAATSLALVGFVVMMIFPRQIVGLFDPSDESLGNLGSHAVRICMTMFPVVGFQIVSASYFQAVGKPKEAMFLSLSRQVLFLIPAVLILPRFFGLDGVWAAMPTADLLSSLLTGFCLFLELRHLDKRHSETIGSVG